LIITLFNTPQCGDWRKKRQTAARRQLEKTLTKQKTQQNFPKLEKAKIQKPKKKTKQKNLSARSKLESRKRTKSQNPYANAREQRTENQALPIFEKPDQKVHRSPNCPTKKTKKTRRTKRTKHPTTKPTEPTKKLQKRR